MGSDDYHVSAELHQEVERRRKLEEAAHKWFDGEISDKRMAEIVFGLINEEAQR